MNDSDFVMRRDDTCDLTQMEIASFDEREMRLIRNCRAYADNDPAGLPGHNLMIIVAKLSKVAEFFNKVADDD